jgi:acyl-CoA dehydrogenase
MVRQEPAATAFALSPAQRALAHEVRQLAGTELRAVAETRQPGEVNRDLIKAMGRLGLLARLFPGPAARGTRTVPATELCLLWEALATECTGAAMALIMQGVGTHPVQSAGSPEQVERWLPAVAAGDAVAALAVAEPGKHAGTVAPAVEMAAEPDGDEWRLTGEKTWVYHAPDADFYTVFARTEPGGPTAGVSAFVVPAIRPGLSGERLEIAGGHPVGTLAFDGVPVSRDDMLGEPGQGCPILTSTLSAFRPSAGAFALGIARAALDLTATYLRSPGAAGPDPEDRRAITHLLAGMATRTEAASLLVYAAAAARDAGEPAAAQSAMAQMFAAQAAEYVVAGAMQVHGTEALRSGHLLEHLHREVRFARLHQGSQAAQEAIIAAELTR